MAGGGLGGQITESDRLDPWIGDGNIVLTADGKYFRVHRSVLRAYSEVFKDMFDCPEPSGPRETTLIEGCPVIHLHDAATDLQMILKAMYDRSYPLPYYEKVPLSIVSAFLRLGEKYVIQCLVNEAKARLHCAIAPTLNIASLITSDATISLFSGITDSDPHNFQIMNLLREMDLQAPLPFVMYRCTIVCPLTAIVDGYEFDGTIYSLSRENLRSFILVKSILENFRIQLAQTLRVSDLCHFVSRSTCVCHIHQLWSDELAVGQPFVPWRHEWDNLFCNSCRPELKTSRNAEIRKAWNQIPTAFGFDSWAEVMKSGDRDFPSLP